MVILTTTTEKNIVWYSPIKQNKKGFENIINGMMRRFLDSSTLRLTTNKIQFYDNETKNIIAEVSNINQTKN